MAGDVRVPVSGEYGSVPRVTIEGTGTILDGKRPEAVVVIDPATGLPASFGAVGVSGGSVTAADGALVTVGALADAASASTLVGLLKNIKASLATPSSYARSDTYTGTANGTTVTATANPATQYSLSVKGTGAAADAWSVLVQVSLDGTNWTTILTHATGDGDGTTKSVVSTPATYVRTRCASTTLGSATNVVARLVAVR